MHIKEALGWLSLIVLEFGLFVFLDGKHMQAAIILAIVGLAGLATSVYLYHQHEVKIPGWIAFCVATQMAVVYDYYDRRQAMPQGVILAATLTLLGLAGLTLYRTVITAHRKRIESVRRGWRDHANKSSEWLSRAVGIEWVTNEIDVAKSSLERMIMFSVAEYTVAPDELLHPLSDRVFKEDIKEWSGHPLNVWLFQQAFNFLRGRVPELEKAIPERYNERTSDEIIKIMDGISSKLKDDARNLRAKYYEEPLC